MTNVYLKIKVKHVFNIDIYVQRTRYRGPGQRERIHRGGNLLEKTIKNKYKGWIQKTLMEIDLQLGNKESRQNVPHLRSCKCQQSLCWTCTSHIKLEPHLTLQCAGDVVASCAFLDRHWSPPMWGIDIPRSLWHCYALWAIYMDPNGLIVRRPQSSTTEDDSRRRTCEREGSQGRALRMQRTCGLHEDQLTSSGWGTLLAKVR